GTNQELLPMNLATHAGLIAGTSVLTIASTGTAGDLDSVIDGIINDSATISGDDGFEMSGMFAYGFANGYSFIGNDPIEGDTDDFDPGIGEASIKFDGEVGGFNWTMQYNFAGGFYEDLNGDTFGTAVLGLLGAADAGLLDLGGGLNDYGFYHESDAGWGVGMGQFRSWAYKANGVDAENTLAMNNSNIGAFLYAAGGYDDMVFAWYEADQFRGGVQFADATSLTLNNNGTVSADNEFDMHYRVEFIAMGDWDSTDCFNSAAGSEQTLAFGIGGFESSDTGGLGGVIGTFFGFVGGNGNQVSHEMMNYDVTYKVGSFGLHAAMGNIELNQTGAGQIGEIDFMTAQASYFVNDDTQVFATMEDIELEANGLGSVDLDLFSGFTVGVNHFYSDNCKATLEYRDTSIDLDTLNLGNASGGDGDGVLAGQIQFTF
ncbi:MAG: hypothetical protein VX104_06475, partial [Planctomycetota bacterium]|nr:hypothetical protein [Planctomycetota bacterium]